MLENGDAPGKGVAGLPSTAGQRGQAAIAIWWIDLDAVDASVATLSPEERARGERLRLPLVRRRFIAGRAVLRRILADKLGCAPAAVELVAGLHGKPALAGAEVAFNLSHSAGVAILAVGGDRPLGVDCEVEGDDGAAMRRTIDPFLSVAERAVLDAERPDAAQLYRLWTRKEAVAKATGLGFRFAFDTVTLLPDSGEEAIARSPEHGVFRLHALDAPFRVAATLCVAGSAALPPIEYHQHPTETQLLVFVP